MALFTRLLTAGLLCASLAAPAQTTTAALVVHPIRSISTADTSFADLEFLTREIGSARVVLLGEPSHGEGNVFEAKARLVRFLQQRMGFTTLAFESGFYEVNKAQQQLDAGVSASEALGNSVFGIWTATQEFQPVEDLIAARKLRVTGFDSQLTGAYGEELVDDLEVFLESQKASAAINYDYLDEVLGFMQHFNGFPAGHTLGEWERNVKLADRLLAGAGTTPARRAAAEQWRQTLRSLQTMARDYVQNDPAVKDHRTFQARDNNPRDAQMADNLLWYLRQHPQEKVICWGATAHFANQMQLIDNAEIQQFRPMGWHVKKALGAQAYILGTATAGGSYAAVGEASQPIAAPPVGSMEARLDSLGAEYLFLNLKQNYGSRRFSAYSIMEYTPLVAEWAQVVDGILFLKTTRPPRLRTRPAAELVAVPDSAGQVARAAAGKVPAGATPGLVLRRAAPAAGNLTVRGRVTDRKTRAAVPFASVALPALGLGVMADAQGNFALAVPRTATGATLQVSSVGYGMVNVAVAAGPLAVVLTPQAYALGDVRVSGESLNPRKIMKRVLAAAPANYEQNDYVAQVYTRRQISNFDTLRHAVEYVSQIFEPAGYRHFGGGFLMMGPTQKHRVQETNVLVQSPTPLGPFDLAESGQGFYSAAADPVRISPLFKSRTLGKFVLRLDSVLQQGDETTYLISFAAKRANHRTTGTYLEAGYSGRVYVRQQDHAVVRYEALWQGDTVQMNATAHKYYGRQNLTARLYASVLTDSRTSHVVTYQKAATGRYYVATSAAQGISAGRVLGKRPFFNQKFCEEHFSVLPAGTLPLPANPELDPRFAGSETYQLNYVKHRPAFWQTYQRPAPAEPAPTLNAKQP
ncbi:erythromycin esterase family protein [Hymenobacter algoricola]|uniref:Erythromycin esterase family protein n=1 Tax=Hymenobacter algoricola TaxID=486267 RepID=A0ABP7MI51_9BACT